MAGRGRDLFVESKSSLLRISDWDLLKSTAEYNGATVNYQCQLRASGFLLMLLVYLDVQWKQITQYLVQDLNSGSETMKVSCDLRDRHCQL